MIRPIRSPVAPRVVSPISGDVTPLVDQIEGLLARPKHVRVRVEGEGHVEALNHLAASMSEMIASGRLRLDDEIQPFDLGDETVTVVTSKLIPCDLVLSLCGWSRDDMIEYLLARHRNQCRSVMGRLEGENLRYASGSPAVWQWILDEMVADPNAREIESIVVDQVHRRIGNERHARALADMMLMHSAEALEMFPLASVLPASVSRVLSRPDVAFAFTNERLLERLRLPQIEELRTLLSHRWPFRRLKAVAMLIDGSDQIPMHLQKVFADGRSASAPTCATLLCLCDPAWKPSGTQMCLRGGRFDSAIWPEIDLSSADLNQATFCDANLARAKFNAALLKSVDFSGSDLRFADFSGLPSAPDVDEQHYGKGQSSEIRQANTAHQVRLGVLDIVSAVFSGADLSHANLSGRCFQRCDMANANLTGVRACGVIIDETLLDGANLSRGDFSESRFVKVDFRNTLIDDSSFCCASFSSLKLDEVSATNVSFQQCDLSYASMTESTLTGCNFHEAILVNARLAEINWEDCDLRDADLRGCSFHLGSTRCGMVGSPYPSHGTRTGFYTDDFDEQYFKSPETIRKANLCGSDLRGADISGIDFYLVDLRGAKFDAGQRKQFVATGAILND
ncbi:Secreted effector protein pipB2 [Stieleria maiorica]|uniref:Secreted effector protein pipB2 n=1 Tax=Stieleria maiorica TaxID=2795974 RepID=A0A5B9MDA8_9BACT|nr:pentapeptide repeat-containing protein [Stieleria maiorica]QEF98226.1 Secreted effector protein pipB2 [Stieleria maiorica]